MSTGVSLHTSPLKSEWVKNHLLNGWYMRNSVCTHLREAVWLYQSSSTVRETTLHVCVCECVHEHTRIFISVCVFVRISVGEELVLVLVCICVCGCLYVIWGWAWHLDLTVSISTNTTFTPRQQFCLIASHLHQLKELFYIYSRRFVKTLGRVFLKDKQNYTITGRFQCWSDTPMENVFTTSISQTVTSSSSDRYVQWMELILRLKLHFQHLKLHKCAQAFR